MKRGEIVFTQELLKELLKDRIPEDFKLSGVEYRPLYNTIHFHGYSEQFHETLENCQHMNETNGIGWKLYDIPVQYETSQPTDKKPWWREFW